MRFYVFKNIKKTMASVIVAAFVAFPIHLIAGTVPVITTEPVDVNSKSGDTAVFRIAVQGDSLKFQWQRDSSNGAFVNYTGSSNIIQSDSLLKKRVAITDTFVRSYRCVVSNRSGIDTSKAAKLTIKTPPIIVSSPLNDTVAPGAACTFKVVATSKYPPLSFQWQKSKTGATGGGGPNPVQTFTPISGAKDSVYIIAAVSDTDHGYYFRCVVTDSAGSNNSETARLFLTAGEAPKIIAEPANVTVNANDSAKFKISLTGKFILQFQWYRDSAGTISMISGGGGGGGQGSYTQRDSILKIRKAARADSGVKYQVIVINTAGRDTSAWAILNVNPTGIIMKNVTKASIHFAVTPRIVRNSQPIIFTFNTPAFGEATLRVYNFKGSCIFSDAWIMRGTLDGVLANSYTWDLKNSAQGSLAAGYYFAVVEIKGSSKNIVEKTSFEIIR